MVASFAIFDDIHVDEKERTVKARGLAQMKLQCIEPGAETLGRYEMRSAETVVAAGATHTVRYVYRIRDIEGLVTAKQVDDLWKKTVRYWASKEPLTSGNETFDHLYAVSRNGLKALLARSGKRDGGYWMYNMQWARDDSMMAMAMLQAGFIDEAKVILTKIIEQFVGFDGRTVEASRWAGFDYTEIDQNGAILYAIWTYWCWTGDTAFIKKYWTKIRLAGDFPLMDVFRDPTSRLLGTNGNSGNATIPSGSKTGLSWRTNSGSHSDWRREAISRTHLATRLLQRAGASASSEIKNVVLNDPRFRFIEEGHFIKRRTRDGRWQRFMIPTRREAMPPGSPIATEERPECEPDTANVYPVVYEWVDPKGEVGRKTLEHMEASGISAGHSGGYSRYNTASEPDPGGPGPLRPCLLPALPRKPAIRIVSGECSTGLTRSTVENPAGGSNGMARASPRLPLRYASSDGPGVKW